MHRDTNKRAEFGDFQTPGELAFRVCALLARLHVDPIAVLEPTCGVGNFIDATLETFPQARTILGFDVNSEYVACASDKAKKCRPDLAGIRISQCDFFTADWQQVIACMDSPLLVIGNPPWVTNTDLSKLKSSNLPGKSNTNMSGYEAISGKSNFDISEWMLVRLLECLNGRDATLAMLCKTSVARKVMTQVWRTGLQVQSSRIYRIDSREHFGVSVDACLLICSLAPNTRCETCAVFEDLSNLEPSTVLGYREGHTVSNIEDFERARILLGSQPCSWRSGVKHDCSKVMELTRVSSGLVNGLHETVDIEDDFLFPLFKSSDIARGRVDKPRRYLLLPQRKVGDNTAAIQAIAPRTWSYLQSHAAYLDQRRSVIYKKQPRFAVFGIGAYTFAPWKVAVSGLYKEIVFTIVPPFDQKPSVLDDTCYFLPCNSMEYAQILGTALNSDAARDFYKTFMFSDSKRPITAELLCKLDLVSLFRILGSEERFDELARGEAAILGVCDRPVQGLLFN